MSSEFRIWLSFVSNFIFLRSGFVCSHPINSFDKSESRSRSRSKSKSKSKSKSNEEIYEEEFVERRRNRCRERSRDITMIGCGGSNRKCPKYAGRSELLSPCRRIA